MMSIPTPHDALAKSFLSDVEIAEDFLTSHLPKEVKALCDFSTLQVCPSAFVDDELKQYFSDILYSLKLNDQYVTGGGKQA